MILCDTTFLVDVLRKNLAALELLKQLKLENLFTTEISIMELYFGLYSNKYLQHNEVLLNKRKEQILGILNHFIVLQFDRKSAVKTAEITGKLSIMAQKIDFRDGMIAGIGLANGIKKIITRNVNHFQRIEELKILIY